MDRICILSDFDGTITDRDGLYTFIKNYAVGDWEKIEEDWANGKIDSQECLVEEFKLIPNLSENLISVFIQNDLEIDKYFKEFYNYISNHNIDFYIVSDGIDYFIERILAKYNLKNIKIISNHGEFSDGKFTITFPNKSTNCVNNAGTCKCEILKSLKDKYGKIIYIGDGVSDYCVSDKADILYAKSRLAAYCDKKGIHYTKYENFKQILENINTHLCYY